MAEVTVEQVDQAITTDSPYAAMTAGSVEMNEVDGSSEVKYVSTIVR